jgi:squalene-hopene/tetraprenyl-beta-curcumene cyclase
MSAMVLAANDAATSGRLHDRTRQALDRMWTVQKADGGFDWLKCDWPPMESDDHYGATIALIAAGAAPEQYASTEPAQNGIARLKTYLQVNPPPTLHHAAMVLWASTCMDGILSDTERQKTMDDLRAIQRPDGGWCLASMGDWKRADEQPQDSQSSDGYATGLVIYVLRRAGFGGEHECGVAFR